MSEPQPQSSALVEITKPSDISTMIRRSFKNLPAGIDINRVAYQMAVSAYEDPMLLQCTPESLLITVTDSFALNLSIPVGEAYPIARKNGALSKRAGKTIYTCSLQSGYPGVLKHAYNSGFVSSVSWGETYPGDTIRFDRVRNKIDVIVLPANEDREDFKLVEYFWVSIELKTGGTIAECWSRARVEAHRDRFAGYKDEFGNYHYGKGWRDDPIAMGRKSVLIRALKRVPKSTELAMILQSEYQTLSGSPITGVRDEKQLDELFQQEQQGQQERNNTPPQDAIKGAANMYDTHPSDPTPEPETPATPAPKITGAVPIKHKADGKTGSNESLPIE